MQHRLSSIQTVNRTSVFKYVHTSCSWYYNFVEQCNTYYYLIFQKQDARLIDKNQNHLCYLRMTSKYTKCTSQNLIQLVLHSTGCKETHFSENLKAKSQIWK